MAELPSGWVFIPKLNDMKTIEIEQYDLVLCKDCKYWSLERLGKEPLCSHWQRYTFGTDYCSYAEKDGVD